ncbi:MAG: DUF1877 family protein [Flavobacterium sp.]
MGYSVTFYEINKNDFNKIKEDISFFKIQDSKSIETLEQNTFGIEFILKKIFDSKHYEIIEEIFNPKEFLGEKPDYENTNFDEIDFYEIPVNSINYLKPNQILGIYNLLNSISDSKIREAYKSSELNSHGIYPEVWHDDESDDQAFNKKHICEGFEKLKSIFNRANNNGNYIFIFNG